MRPIIASPNWSDVATLTANSEHSEAIATQLQEIQPKHFWQSTTDTGVFLSLNRGSSEDWNLVALLFHNLSTSATIRIRADDVLGNLTTSPDHDSTALSAWQSQDLSTWSRRHFVYWPGTQETHQYMRIDLEDASNPDGVLRAGRLYVSQAWQSSIHMQLGLQYGYDDLASIQQSAIDGTTFIREIARPLHAQFTLGYLTEAEYMDNLFELTRLRGMSQDILLVMDTPPISYLQSKILYGRFAGSLPFVRPQISRFEQRIEAVELL